MTDLISIQEELRDLNALIARHERVSAVHPDTDSLRANIKTLRRRRQVLEEAFSEAAARVEVDICSYRLVPVDGRLSIATLSRVLNRFQTLFSLVYSAIKTGPKQRARLSTEVTNNTSFGYAYSFAGSVGFIMTLPKEQLLSGETHLDEAMQVVFHMARAKSSREVADFARRLGPSPVRAMYEWANDHIADNLEVDIEWRQGEEVRSSLFVQKSQLEQLRKVMGETNDEREEVRSSLFVQKTQLEQLRRAIDETRDETEEELDVVGNLVGADVNGKTFHIETKEGEEIRGIFADAISEEHTVTLPKPCSAKIRKTKTIIYPTGKERISYLLLSLRSI